MLFHETIISPILFWRVWVVLGRKSNPIITILPLSGHSQGERKGSHLYENIFIPVRLDSVRLPEQNVAGFCRKNKGYS